MTEQPTRKPIAAEDEAATVADLMSPALGVFRPDMTVAQTVAELRELTRSAIITYCYVTEADGKLVGVVVMRDMLLATPKTRLDAIMLKDVYAFSETMELEEALKAAVTRHYPVYPVCNAAGVLTGLVRGEELFRNQAIEISAQSGKMVGVDKEERLTTPLMRSLIMAARSR